MKKNLILASVAFITLAGCVSQHATTFRQSADGTREILYLHPFIALAARRVKEEQKATPHAPDFAYYLARAHWLHEPEIASHTGDRETGLVGHVTEIGWVPSKSIIFGIGRDPEADWLDTSITFFILSLDRVEFFATRKQMNESLELFGIHNTTTVDPKDIITKYRR